MAGILPHLKSIAGTGRRKAYGVMCNFDEDGNFDYICGVEVTDFSRVPADWTRVRIPAQEYAVFTHPITSRASEAHGQRSGIGGCQNQAEQVADAPNFELYGENFDSVTGRGLVEIWLPLEPKGAR